MAWPGDEVTAEVGHSYTLGSRLLIKKIVQAFLKTDTGYYSMISSRVRKWQWSTNEQIADVRTLGNGRRIH